MPARRLLAPALVVPLLLLGATPALAKGPVKTTTAATYDVSYPQCGAALPTNADGGIVGVNNGVVFSANPCVASEWAWAAHATKYAPAFYANTANPGPAYSKHWPAGQQTPQVCDGSNSAACSYDYGWNAVRDSFNDALAATPSPESFTWWLDVETGNSWETLESAYGQTATAKANDTASLQGAIAGLQSMGVTSAVGIYSTSYQWGQITGGTGSTFATSPAWVAGTGSLSTAQSHCTATGFTGGPVALAQYAKSGYDADWHC